MRPILGVFSGFGARSQSGTAAAIRPVELASSSPSKGKSHVVDCTLSVSSSCVGVRRIHRTDGGASRCGRGEALARVPLGCGSPLIFASSNKGKSHVVDRAVTVSSSSVAPLRSVSVRCSSRRRRARATDSFGAGPRLDAGDAIERFPMHDMKLMNERAVPRVSRECPTSPARGTRGRLLSEAELQRWEELRKAAETDQTRPRMLQAVPTQMRKRKMITGLHRTSAQFLR